MQLKKEAEARAAAYTVGTLPTVVDMNVYQGDDFYLNITLGPSSPAIDLTLYTVKAEIRQSPGAGSVLATFISTTPAANVIALHLPAVQSKLLNTTAAWDVQITDGLGAVTTVARGAVNVTKEVTK